jgi:hypothetical protein
MSTFSTEQSNIGLLLLLLFITFMQCICNHIPETNHVSRVSNVAATSWLQFMVHEMLRLYYYFPKYVCSAQYGCFL